MKIKIVLDRNETENLILNSVRKRIKETGLKVIDSHILYTGEFDGHEFDGFEFDID